MRFLLIAHVALYSLVGGILLMVLCSREGTSVALTLAMLISFATAIASGIVLAKDK